MDTIQIAIADDHPAFRFGLITFINSFDNCQIVHEAANGKELLYQLSTCDTLPDICVIDISMPELNGYDTLTALKKRWPELKVIIISMITEEYAILKMIQKGADGFLFKSGQFHEYRNAIDAVANGGYYFTELIPKELIQKAGNSVLPSISKRQLEFLALCATDMNYSQIAQKMGIGIKAVESLAHRLSEKLNIHSRAGLALFFQKVGLSISDK